MVDLVALQTELDELYVVRRKLLTGGSVESVDIRTAGSASRSVSFSPVDLERVEARIRSLEQQLGLNVRSRRRPIGVSF